jgi:Uri superfamily endonuclease
MAHCSTPAVKRRRDSRPFVSYQLHIRVSRGLSLAVGRLGAIDFPRGAYVYTGSAKKNMEARIARHLSAHKTLRWHIDYLLAAPGVTVQRVVRSRRPECHLNQAVPGTAVAKGFGSSDCTARCGSHLKRLITRS